MKDGIVKQSPKSIAHQTFNLKRKQKVKFQRPFETVESPITGNPHAMNSGLANNLATIDFNSKNPLGELLSISTAKMADIEIYHAENNVAIN